MVDSLEQTHIEALYYGGFCYGLVPLKKRKQEKKKREVSTMGYTKSKGKKAEENGKAKESKIVKAILKCIEEKGVLPWHNELIVSQIKGTAMPVTLGANKKPYRGVNAFLTAMYMVVEGYDSNQFMTFNAIKKAGGRVNKGATGCPIVLPIFRYYDKDKNTYTEQQVKEMTEEEKEEKRIRQRFIGLQQYVVFNLSQTSLEYEKVSIEEVSEELKRQSKKNTRAEDIVNGYLQNDGPKLLRTVSRRGTCCYQPYFDTVSVPEIENFKSEAGYYATLFHELIHSTGHETRLKRDLTGGFGSKSYAEEEMIAELGASLLMESTSYKLEEYIDNSAAYLASWTKAITEIEDFDKVLYWSFSGARKAANWILGERENYTKEKEEEMTA